MKVKTQKNNVIYALHYKGRLLGSFKWNKSNPDLDLGLYGWRPPKKVYFTLGYAESGLKHLPKEIQKDTKIVEYHPVCSSILKNLGS